MVAYKLFKVRNGLPCTLFHGWHGSRALPLDQWLHAERRRGWNPGKRIGEGFITGWHVLATERECREYLARFKHPEKLIVCRVRVDSIGPKPRSAVALAGAIKVQSSDWSACAAQ